MGLIKKGPDLSGPLFSLNADSFTVETERPLFLTPVLGYR